MGKIAFVFPGQGAQFPGMGLDFYQNAKAARGIFDAADAIRPGTARQCFEGTDSELCETRNTQPCVFAVEMAAAAALGEAGIRAEMAAGFSLGELAALTFTGAVDLQTGFRLVCRRGELMQRAAEQKPASMAAVLRLTNEEVQSICAGFSGVYPVNYNCPGQVSVSGLESEMPAFLAAVKAAGGRALPLKVGGGFHSPFMKEAAEAFADALKPRGIKAPAVPLYSDYTGQIYSDDIRDLLAKQICNPVLWETIVRNMIAAGADTFLELGPGRTLCGLIGKIDNTVRTFGVSDMKELDVVIKEVKV